MAFCRLVLEYFRPEFIVNAYPVITLWSDNGGTGWKNFDG